MAQRLVELVDSGRIADEAALKRAFRRLAKRIHPDLAPSGEGREAGTAGPEGTGRAFIALRAEYEEALARFRMPSGALRDTEGKASAGAEKAAGREREPAPVAKQATRDAAPRRQVRPRPGTWTARAFIEGLEDLLGRGFPNAPARSLFRASYEASRENVLGLLAARDLFLPPGNSVGAFLDFEEGLGSIMAASVPNRPMEARFAYYLRNLVTNIIYYHRDGFPQPLAYSRNEWSRLEKELRGRGEERPIAFLAMLMADLDAGPACLGD